jgi:hypothetical protein
VSVAGTVFLAVESAVTLFNDRGVFGAMMTSGPVGLEDGSIGATNARSGLPASW